MVDFFSLILFAFLMVASPGPSNVLLIAAGTQYGYRKNLVYITGLITGMALLNIAVGFGLATIITDSPLVNLVFKVVSAGYIIYLASFSFKSKKKNLLTEKEDRNKNITSGLGFTKGVIFHLLNPKAWTMLVLAWSKYSSQFGEFNTQLIVLVLIFAVVQIICANLYCFAGSVAAKWLKQNIWLSKVMSVLTITLVLYFLID